MDAQNNLYDFNRNGASHQNLHRSKANALNDPKFKEQNKEFEKKKMEMIEKAIKSLK